VDEAVAYRMPSDEGDGRGCADGFHGHTPLAAGVRIHPTVRAARIVRAMARPRPGPHREIDVDHPDAPGVAFVFDPPRRAPDGAVVIVPGLAVRAHHDERLHTLARAFAAGGLRGIVLQVPDMGHLRIRPQTEVDLAARLSALVDAGHVPHDRLGLLGPSFSGSLALRAAAQPRAASLVHSVLTVGAFADAARTVDFLFHHPDADPYGRMVLLLNFLPQVQPTSPRLLHALRAAIHDTSREPDQAELPKVLHALPDDERATLEALLHDPPTWRATGEAMLQAGAPHFEAMSVAPIVDQLRCAVFVLHGAHDTIVPPDESRHLHQALLDAGRPSRLLITRLLDHASVTVGADVIQQAWRMLQGFAFFVRGMGV